MNTPINTPMPRPKCKSMTRLPKPILHIRIPYTYSEEEEEAIHNSIQSAAKEYVVILTCDAESKVEMQVHSIIPNELSEEKATEIIDLLNNLK